MFWTVEKLQQRLNELDPYRYKEHIELSDWEAMEDEEKANGVRPPAFGKQKQPFRKGDRWIGRDRYLWLRREVTVPSEWSGRKIVGLFDFGRTGPGNNASFESLLYVNGTPFQGVDTNHKEVLLPASAAGTTAEFVFRLWSGLEGGGRPTEQEHRFREAQLAILDEDTDDLFYSGRAILDTVKLMADREPEKQELLKALDRAFLQLDWSRAGSEAFYRSVRIAAEQLRTQMAEWTKRHAVTVTCVGHTHIDVAWLWRLTHTREKAARSFSTVLRLMEQFPEYVFLQTQPQLYEYIKRDYPELYDQIKERIRDGRWEAGGAMWVEADCNLTSGESLVRQLLYGTRFMRDEFGAECRYLWLPDVFGYSWALPQILRKSGIDAFMTTKISWNQYNRMPHDTFRWRGIDGTDILTHFITTPDMPDNHAPYYTYNGVIEPFSVKGIWEQYRDKNVNQELLLSYGYGDGGGGVNREMLEMRRRLDRLPGMPNVRTGRADDYFERLGATVEATDEYVHTWDGELYLEYHRGTYTSQAYNKRMNRKLELLYRDVEWLQATAAIESGTCANYPTAAINEGWKILLRNQFHDIIPGSSIAEVYADSKEEYGEAETYGQDAWSQAVATLQVERSGGGDGTIAFSVTNSAPYPRTDFVQWPSDGMEEGRWVGHDGRPLAADKRDGRWNVLAESIPSMGSAGIVFIPGNPEAASEPQLFQGEERRLTTPHYILEWNGQGQLIRIYDRDFDREVLSEGEAGNVLQVFEDKPKQYDAWDIDLYYQEKMRIVRELRHAEIAYCGRTQAVVRFEWTYGDSVIRQNMRVYAHSRRIDFETEADWRESQQLLKVAFPVAVRSTEATYDIQFGNVKRPTHWNTSWDYARFETVGHQWADLSERGYGVGLLNDCKYGYDIKDHTMRLSLIKSAIFPDPHADQGFHQFTYALLPHAGDWFEGRVAREAWNLNAPLRLEEGTLAANGKSLLRFAAENVHVDAVKKAEDGDYLVVRLHEFAGQRTRLILSSDYAVESWQESDLMERPIGETERAKECSLTLLPYEIKTVLVRFAGQ